MGICVGITASSWSQEQEGAQGGQLEVKGLTKIDHERERECLLKDQRASTFSRIECVPWDVLELEVACKPELSPAHQWNLVQLEQWPQTFLASQR